MQHHSASNAPVAWNAESRRVGDWRVTALSDGFLRLDGGSMWGVVPAPLWRPLTPPAEDNSILLALRPFLLERIGGANEKVIVEPGVGDRWDAKLRAIYGLHREQTLQKSLAQLEIDPLAITHVIASHCHWDHIGAQVVEREGELAPLFPNARHFAPAIEVEMAKHADHVRRASYRAADVVPIEAAGLLETYSGDVELIPDVTAHELGGHSDGSSVITLESGGETAVFWGDVVPTTHHVQPPYIMAYDIDVVRSFEVRSEWLARAAEGRYLGLFYHDVDFPFARLARNGRRYSVELA